MHTKVLRRWRAVLVILLLLLVASVGLWLNHERLLRGCARFWVVDEAVEPSDAIVIFGGGIETRPAAAAEYMRQGWAHRILVSNVGPVLERQKSNSHTAQNLSELRKHGVADGVVEIFGCDLSNTFQEALALKRWSSVSGARSFIMPTEYFAARRVRWIVQRVFEGTGVQVRVPVISSLYYLRGDWWNHADAPWAFGREVIKYLGYRFIYGLLLSRYEPGKGSDLCKPNGQVTFQRLAVATRNP